MAEPIFRSSGAGKPEPPAGFITADVVRRAVQKVRDAFYEPITHEVTLGEFRLRYRLLETIPVQRQGGER